MPEPVGTADVTVVLPVHRERTLLHHTLRAIDRCVEHAASQGVVVAFVAVLDRPDPDTRDFVHDSLGVDRRLLRRCEVRVVEVDEGDAGSARNIGVVHATSEHVAMLDADNLPTRTWLADAVRVLWAHGAPAVAHPEVLVTFGDRRDVWRQRSTLDPRFNPGNLVDHNYWDTVCVAPRTLFERFPYAATGGGSGFGFEDWHWGTRLVAHGIDHLAVPATAYFYRIKQVGSVNDSHHTGGSVLRPSELFVDVDLARAVLADDAERRARAEAGRRVLPVQAKIVAARDAGRRPTAAPPSPPALVVPGPWWRRDPGLVPAEYRYLYADVRRLDDTEAVKHYRRHGRAEGRRARLTDRDRELLAPASFDALEYRALHADLTSMTNQEARRHYLDTGHAEGRRGRLTDAQVDGLRRLDVDDYRDAHADLLGFSDAACLAHFLEHGLAEGRRTLLDDGEREELAAWTVEPWLEDEWRALHHLEPLVQVPTEPVVTSYRHVGAPPGGRLSDVARAWWQLVDALGGRWPDAVVFAPWMRMGGADILVARYADLLASSSGSPDVVVCTTLAHSTRPDLVPPGVRLLDLPALPGWTGLGPDAQRLLVACLVVQLAPEMVHVINSPAAYDAVELHPQALSAATRLHLSTFVVDHGPDGEIYSYLVRRRTGFLDPVSSVIVDNEALVEQLHELYCYPPSLFHVHHQPVELPARRSRPTREPWGRLRVVWAARFDRQKRLDVLADVVDAVAAAGIEVDWHVHGSAVMDETGATAQVLDRLSRAGVTVHPPYASFEELQPDRTDAFVLTSENEGIPLTLLDVMAHEVPVVAPLVGGIGELVSGTTGWPVRDFADPAQYVAAIAAIQQSPEVARSRAEAARDLLATEFSWAALHRRVAETPGYGATRGGGGPPSVTDGARPRD